MTQSEKVLKHIQKHGSITQLEAYELYGIMRLGARIHDLKRAGHMIRETTERSKNRYGEPVHYARYFIA